MRLRDIKINSRVVDMTDADRLEWIEFLVSWLSGKFMTKQTPDHVEKWRKFNSIWPHDLTGGQRLYRVMVVPKEHMFMKDFNLKSFSLGPISSWTKTKIGMDCVAGIASDFTDPGDREKTSRVGVVATIDSSKILADVRSIKRAFVDLTHDFTAEQAEPGASYLGNKDFMLISDIDYYLGCFKRYRGGPYRQWEVIVINHPVSVSTVYVYREGLKHVRYGNDDPHN